MLTLPMPVVATVIRLTRLRRYTTADRGRRALAAPKTSSAPPRSLTRRFDVSRSRDHGFDVYRVGAAAGPAVIYLHGGAYSSEIVSQHWDLIGHIAAETGRPVHVPIYGLAPAHHGLTALEFVQRVIADVGRCYLAGDSAGGGLALIAAQNTPGPVAGLTLMAPWLDLTMSNPGIDQVEPHDPWLRRAGLHPMAAAWAGDLPLTDPRLSPINGDLTGLPPTQILVGTRDITLPDCRLLRDRMPPEVPLTYHEQPGAIHVYPLLPVPEARAGRAAIVNHIRAAIG
ncbi:alpha/beta hydrolase fold domain-containing protein [Actinoplanes sp. NPDC049265]|uniref:alpha/beta hydrolase fold domain-containing protein n=1 Tax=Actinoplanes sp. NPDC049265 TaxID=3363902 RepID=UPI003722B36F